MRNRLRPSPALTVATIALVAALCGTATGQSVVSSATKLVTGKKIKDGSVGTRDLSRRARRQLRGQRGPVGPRGPVGARGATGQTAALPALEPRRAPQLGTGWTNASGSFYKDRSGLVHIEGRVIAPASGGPHAGTILTLPPGYRPPQQELFVYSRAGAFGDLVIEPDGRVRANSPLPGNGESVSFGGLTFRPAG